MVCPLLILLLLSSSCAKGAASHALKDVSDGGGDRSQRGVGGGLDIDDSNNNNNNNKALSPFFCDDSSGEICYNQVSLVQHVSSSEEENVTIYEWMANDSEWVRLVLDNDDNALLCGCGGGDKNQDHQNLLQITMSPQDDPQDEDGGTGEEQERWLQGVGKKSSSSSSGKKGTTAPTPAPVVCNTCCGGTTQATISKLDPACEINLYFSFASGQVLFCYTGSTVQNFQFFNSTPFPQPTCTLLQRRQRELGPQDDDGVMMPKHKSALAFVRVPKTGSTTMIRNLLQMPDLYAWLDHLSTMPQQDNKQNKKQGSAIITAAASCVYASVPTTAHLGANFFHQDKNKESGAGASSSLGGCLSAGGASGGGGWNACPHVPYPKLVRQWSKTLDYWEPPKTAAFEQDAVPGSFSFGLRAFSIVRDPFDRLVSYFEYLGRFAQTNQFLKQSVTEEQYQRVQAGDLYGWMELLHEQGGGCGLELPFQYRYFHDDLDTAIALIQQDEETGAAPKIFVVLTECYETSLRLLAERFDEFKAESVDAFVASPEYKSNRNKNSITNRASYLKKDQDTQGLESLRQLAQEWFKDDFVFYDVAVKQFQQYMEKSQLDPTHFESCAHWNGGGSNAADV